MKRSRRRQRPEHSWDRLRGTRLEVLPLDGGTVRRVCVNVDDPMATVVSFGTNALVAEAGDGPVLRFVAVDNWNHDPRELHQIPEAREWFRRLWHEGKTLLRLLSESSADTPADDRLGLSQRDVSQLGLGWFDVWTLGMCDIVGAQLEHTTDGPVWGLEAVGPRGATREAVRAELLQRSTTNPEGFTFDAAANRRVFMANNMAGAIKASQHMGRDADDVVLVLSLLDPVAGDIARQIVDADAIQRTMADCRRRDLHPAAILAAPRAATVPLLEHFAPEAARRIAAGRPESGWHWAVFVAYGGTTLATVPPPEETP